MRPGRVYAYAQNLRALLFETPDLLLQLTHLVGAHARPVSRIEEQNDRALPPRVLERHLVVPAVAGQREIRGLLTNLRSQVNLLASPRLPRHSTVHPLPWEVESSCGTKER